MLAYTVVPYQVIAGGEAYGYRAFERYYRGGNVFSDISVEQKSVENPQDSHVDRCTDKTGACEFYETCNY